MGRHEVSVRGSFTISIYACTPYGASVTSDTSSIVVSGRGISCVSEINFTCIGTRFRSRTIIASNTTVRGVVGIFTSTRYSRAGVVTSGVLIGADLHFSILCATSSSGRGSIHRYRGAVRVDAVISVGKVTRNSTTLICTGANGVFFGAGASGGGRLAIVSLTNSIGLSYYICHGCSRCLSSSTCSIGRSIGGFFAPLRLSISCDLIGRSCSDTIGFRFRSISVSRVLSLSISLSNSGAVRLSTFIVGGGNRVIFVSSGGRVRFTRCRGYDTCVSSCSCIVGASGIVRLEATVTCATLDCGPEGFGLLSGIRLGDNGRCSSPTLTICFTSGGRHL